MSSGVLIAGIEEVRDEDGDGDRRRDGGGASSRLKSILTGRLGVENGYGFCGELSREELLAFELA